MDFETTKAAEKALRRIMASGSLLPNQKAFVTKWWEDHTGLPGDVIALPSMVFAMPIEVRRVLGGLIAGDVEMIRSALPARAEEAAQAPPAQAPLPPPPRQSFFTDPPAPAKEENELDAAQKQLQELAERFPWAVTHADLEFAMQTDDPEIVRLEIENLLGRATRTTTPPSTGG